MNDSHAWLGRVRRTACAALLIAASAAALAQGADPGTAPAGEYRVDPAHASLQFRIRHLGLSNYWARFTHFDVTVNWKPEAPAASSVTMTVDPRSIRTDYAGDFVAGHKGSPWKTFEEELSRDPKFFNTDKFPQASFRSTRVEVLGPGKWRIHGDLTLLGQTKPIALDAALVGQTAKHLGSGVPALGPSASGTIKRSDFGMDYLVQPPILGDEITIQFEGEFQQAPAS
jgi:polyisoprenoid-binding protein YceI